MKRIVITLALVAALSLTFLTVTAGFLTAVQDDVVLTETVLVGDPAAARGLTITSCLQDKERTAFWKTEFTPGEDRADTEFIHHILRQDTVPESYSKATVSSGSTSFGAFGLLTQSDADDTGLLIRPALDVASRAKLGQRYTETVSLADYYDYYPMNVELHIQEEDRSWYFSSEHVKGMDLTEAFHITVPEDHLVEITVEKDMNGDVVEVHSADVGGWRGYHWGGAVDDNGIFIYLPLEGISAEADAADGVWFIPVIRGSEEYGIGELQVKMDQRRLLYPLDLPQEDVLDMELRGDRQLLLITREEGALTLTVLDRFTGDVLQRLETVPASTAGRTMSNWCQEDFLVLSYDSRFMVLEDREGIYAPALEGEFQHPEWERFDWYLRYGEAVAWDGERLAVVTQGGQGEHYYLGLEVMVKLYDAEGLAYAGHYDMGPGRDPAMGQERAYSFGSKEGRTLSLALEKQ